MNFKKNITKLLALSMAFAFFVAADKKADFESDKATSEEQTEKFMKDVGSKLCWKCCGKKINNGKEFINMKTTLTYSRDSASEPGKEITETRTYGDKERPSEYLKPFPRNKPLQVSVKFFPEMQNKQMYGCEFGGIAVKDLLIYVEIRMEKPRSVAVEYAGGISEDRVKVERDLQGWVTYSLHIKNNLEGPNPEARFTITPSQENASMKMNITYRAASKYVNRESDITETVLFKKMINHL